MCLFFITIKTMVISENINREIDNRIVQYYYDFFEYEYLALYNA